MCLWPIFLEFQARPIFSEMFQAKQIKHALHVFDKMLMWVLRNNLKMAASIDRSRPKALDSHRPTPQHKTNMLYWGKCFGFGVLECQKMSQIQPHINPSNPAAQQCRTVIGFKAVKPGHDRPMRMGRKKKKTTSCASVICLCINKRFCLSLDCSILVTLKN